ncbi:MAG: CDP-alcohol phosphatidyltransferase family protein [bacterium]|nr:CDP-alcohol phosphatidyltransferase family protein [bacterium]
MSKTFNGILPDKFKRWFRDRLNHLSLLLSHFGISPNTLTLISLIFGLIAGVLIAIDHMLLAVLFGIVMGFCDIIDGQLATIANQNNPFGAVLDSSVDRYNESFLFLGLGVHYYLQGQQIWTLVAAFAIIGSFLVSYVRARAEGLNLQCSIGLMQRSERLVLLGIGVILQGWFLKLILLTLVVLTHITVIQRLLYVKNVNANE